MTVMNKALFLLPLLAWSCCEKSGEEEPLPAGADLDELEALLEELENPGFSGVAEQKAGAIPESDRLTYQKALRTLDGPETPAIYTRADEAEPFRMTFEKAKAALEEEPVDTEK